MQCISLCTALYDDGHYFRRHRYGTDLVTNSIVFCTLASAAGLGECPRTRDRRFCYEYLNTCLTVRLFAKETLIFGRGLSSLDFSRKSIGGHKDNADFLYEVQRLVPYQSSLTQEPYSMCWT